VRATPTEIAAIEQAAARAEKAYAGNKIDRFVAANQEFHFAVYRAAHSDLLNSMIESLWLQIGPYLSELVESMRTTALAESLDLGPHNLIVSAIRNRDAAAARAAIAADLQDSTDVYAPYRDGHVAQSA
jgi:DNA-binding GntR family transcriptional regulator